MARHVVVVPHTHWDREWYAPFQSFRLKLVELLDDLLPLLERDPGFAHFMLDGQMAVVDDYLAMRPDEEARLRRLATGGRLALGPWYILMDEFLVSGETIVRNLQYGLDRAATFGGANEIGYLPDMFGHIAQMPQLLRRFGFEHAVVWRGVPAAVDKSAFWWTAPDGSVVRAEYLPEGYGNGAALPADAKDLVASVRRFEEQHGDLLVGPLLWMNGTDHLLPQPWLATVLAEANEQQDDYRFRVDSLLAHVSAGPTEGLASAAGELRSGARANLLMGVASNRVDVKQAAAAAERALERYAEPLSALFLPAAQWPSPFLDEAWRAVIRNSAHDSSCACSHDDVCDAVLVRYQEARHIAEGLTARVVENTAALVASPGAVALNPSGRARTGLVEVMLPGHEPVDGAQMLARIGGEHVTKDITRAEAAMLVHAALDNMPRLQDAELELGPDGVLDIRLRHDPDRISPCYDGPILALARAAATEVPDGPARMTVTTPPRQRALTTVEIPGFGWSRVVPAPRAGVEPVIVSADGRVVRNGLLTVEVSDDGTFALRPAAGDGGAVGLGRLVDDGDSGDTYNYNPPAHDQVIDEADAVAVRVLEPGPLRAVIVIDRRYTWPESGTPGARIGSVTVNTATTLTIEAGSRLVQLSTEVDNRSRDHRLRAWFPLPRPADRSRAECAFAVVERGLTAEGGPTERALPTFPSRRFVTAGGLTIVHEGLLEYELVDVRDGAAHALALTLLRCTGAISRGPMAYRPLPAGPETPTPDAQIPGRRVLRYGVQLGDDISAAYAAADAAFVPFVSGTSRGQGWAADQGTALPIELPDPVQVSSIQRTPAGQLQVRVFNPGPEPATIRLSERSGWIVDLRGRAERPWRETIEVAPSAIVTALLAEPDEA